MQCNDNLRNSLIDLLPRNLYFDSLLINSVLSFPHYFFPTEDAPAKQENLSFAVTGMRPTIYGHLASTGLQPIVPDLALAGKHQCFPLYTYDADGTNRRENVTDWALATFRERYGDAGISKLDIFHYVYGLLHHPGYRERHADSLRRELPRIPLAPDFAAFRDAGRAGASAPQL